MRYRVLKGGGGWREMGRGANRDPAKIFLVSHCVLFFFHHLYKRGVHNIEYVLRIHV